jgi:phosphatidylinositol alpha-mannosyltransferase
VLPAFPDAELWMVCKDAPQRPGVKVLGRVSDDELAALYGRAWVFCLPSSYEGFGIPYAEAMAAGCPVVATPNPGALEVTGGGQFGVIVEPEGVGSAIARLLGDADERERLASAGLERARDYDLDVVTSTYETLYERLIEARR